MYRPVDGNPQMTDHEAAEKYRDSYILMRMNSSDSDSGVILYVGDNESELITLLMELDKHGDCEIVEGLNLQCSLGGVLRVG